jgi:AraC-like DNA-binding protein
MEARLAGLDPKTIAEEIRERIEDAVQAREDLSAHVVAILKLLFDVHENHPEHMKAICSEAGFSPEYTKKMLKEAQQSRSFMHFDMGCADITEREVAWWY